MKSKILILLILILIAISVMPTREPDKKETNLPFIGDVSSTESMSSFLLTGYSKEGKKTWLLKGKTADILSNLIILNSVNAIAYGEETEVNITADQGQLDRNNNNIHLQDNVIARTADGATVKTDYADWDADNQLLTTDAYCEVNDDNITAVGIGALGRPEENHVQLNKEVVVTVEPKEAGDEPNTIITCDGPLEMMYRENIAIFHNNVVVIDEKGIINADLMTVYYHSTTHKIDKVVAQGDVKITRGENISYGQECVYTTVDGKVLLTGEPKIEIYEEE